MLTVLQAFAHQEGFYKVGSRPSRNHNPGDLEFGVESQHFGASHGDPRFAVFENDAAGWDALRRWLSVPAKFHSGSLVGGYLGATLEQVVFRFAPPSENNSTVYLETVCKLTGLTPSTVVTTALLV